MEISKISTIIASLFLLSLTTGFFSVTTAYDPYDPNGNITIRWDVISWTQDGYIANVNIKNNQIYRTVEKPGWKLAWTWAGQEVIWTSIGAHAIDQGNCSRFKGSIPQSCSKWPTMEDLMVGVSSNETIQGCCRGGTLSSRYGGVDRSTARFQISVGNAGTSNKTIRLPQDFMFIPQRGGYGCGPAEVISPTQFTGPYGKRATPALMTWQVVCNYSSHWASEDSACCVSVSSFNKKKKITCPECACACRNMTCNTRGKGENPGFVPPIMKCTNHMCPININWQMLKISRKKGAPDWAAKVSITNYNYWNNHPDWTLLVNHPAINKLTKVLYANHELIVPSNKTSEVIWGIKKINDVINKSGTQGSKISFVMKLYKYNKEGGGRNKSTNYSKCMKDWCVPKEIYFNGDQCVLPSLQTYS